MDKPSQVPSYAGLLIYRIQRNAEYLLLNDSFSRKKHWFCPKGQVINNEDEIECALRAVYETIGLRPDSLSIEEGFALEVKYLSGTRPKKVKYYLAQLTDRHVWPRPNGEGMHLQWLSQPACSEKVIFRSMQEVFSHAQTFIESKRRKNSRSYVPDRTEVRSLAIGGEERGYKSRPYQPPHQQQTTHSCLSQNTSPLYKTRLCEKFETEGSCPYGGKCNFAHGINELRGKAVAATSGNATASVLAPASVAVEAMGDSPYTTKLDDDVRENQLFKTKLCEKFMKDKFCQYGPKCHFAHGEEELKSRPKKEEAAAVAAAERRPSSPPYEQRPQRTNGANNQHDEPSMADQRNNWRSGAKYKGPESGTGTSNRSNALSWRSASAPMDDVTQHMSHLSTEAATAKPEVEQSSIALNSKEDQRRVQLPLDELRRPAFVDHQRPAVSLPAKKSSSSLTTTAVAVSTSLPVPPTAGLNGKEKKHPVPVESNEKSWMKIVKLSKEEQDEMESQSNQLPAANTPAKRDQKETIISELKTFFSSHPASAPVIKGKLTDDVKEVTKVEMRNDLSKKQLLYILLVSLLEDEVDQSMLSILKSRVHLFKTLVKTNADQILLLKAWANFVVNRKPAMVSKTAAALSYWYQCEMVEEEAFLEWYATLEKDSTVEKKSAKFIEWLNESDSEDDD